MVHRPSDGDCSQTKRRAGPCRACSSPYFPAADKKYFSFQYPTSTYALRAAEPDGTQDRSLNQYDREDPSAFHSITDTNMFVTLTTSYHMLLNTMSVKAQDHFPKPAPKRSGGAIECCDRRTEVAPVLYNLPENVLPLGSSLRFIASWRWSKLQLWRGRSGRSNR